MSIEQKLCKNAIRCIDQRLELKNSGISCMVLIFNLKNPRTTRTFMYAKNSVASCEIQEVIYHCFQ